jgi:hypothetical protein
MNDNPFGDIVYRYTRAQAIADGVQVEATELAAEVGIRFPVFITRRAFDTFVTVSLTVTGQDETGRLWDILWMLRLTLAKGKPGQSRLPFGFLERFDGQCPRRVSLLATCGPLDIDDPRPAITVMMLDED